MVIFAVVISISAVLGIQALANAKPVEFNLGTNSTALVKVEVQLLVDGQPLTIYSSQDPASVDYNSIYVDNITDDTINLDNSKLPLTNNSITLIFKSYHQDNKLEVYVNQELKATLAKGSASTPQTSSQITISNLPATPLLGSNLISIRFEPLPNYTVTFVNTETDETIQQVIVGSGDLLAAPTDPTYEDLTFGGWYIDAACQIPFDFANTLINADKTLYAYFLPKNIPIYLESISGDALPYLSSVRFRIYRITDQYLINAIDSDNYYSIHSLDAIGTAISEYVVIDVNANSSNEISLKTIIELNDGEVISSGDYICISVECNRNSVPYPNGSNLIAFTFDKSEQYGFEKILMAGDNALGRTRTITGKVGDVSEIRFSYEFELGYYGG